MARVNESPVSWLRRLSGTLEQIIEGVEGQGGTFDDLKSFVGNPVNIRNIGLLVMGKLKLAGFPCQRLVPHFIPEGLEVVEDVEPAVTEGAKLSFPGFLQDRETYTDGTTMRTRAKEKKANKGLSDVPALLGKDGKGLKTIPAELRGEVFIVLTGTVLRSSSDFLYVPYLRWDGDAWIVRFSRLGRDWRGYDRLVSCE